MIGDHGDSQVAAWSLASAARSRTEDCLLICSCGCGTEAETALSERPKKAAHELRDVEG